MTANIAKPAIIKRRLKLIAEMALAAGILVGGSYYLVRGTISGIKCIAAMQNMAKTGDVPVLEACPLMRRWVPPGLPLPTPANE